MAEIPKWWRGQAWRYGLKVEGQRAPNNVLEWVGGLEPLLQFTFDLGGKQMAALRNGGGPIWAQMWLGGLEGELYQIGRSRIYTPESLAEMFIARHKVMISANGSKPRIEVHEPNQTGSWPKFTYVTPERDDLLLLEAQMRGAGTSFPWLIWG
jgi:hypothetical protein